MFSVCLLACATATAQPSGDVRLSYTRGPGAERCPGDEELRRGVMKRLGRDPFDEHGPRSARVVISGTAGGLIARVAVRGGRGELVGARTLTSPGTDCQELAAAVGLALAMAIDPLAAAASRPDESNATASRPASASQRRGSNGPPPTDRARSAPAGATRRSRAASVTVTNPAPRARPSAPPLRWFASAGALVALGAAPAVTGGATVAFGLRRGPISLALEGRADLARETAVGDGAVSASLGLGALVPCWHLGRAAACGLLAVGALHGSSRDLVGAREERTPFVGAGVRALLEIPAAGRLSLRLHGDVLATLTPTKLDVGELTVWRTSPVSGAVGLSLAGRLW